MLFDLFGFLIEALTVWSFVMAAILNLLFILLGMKERMQAFIVACIFAISYQASSSFTDVELSVAVFFQFFLFDIGTIFVILAYLLLSGNWKERAPCINFCILGLCLNGFIFYGMHFDTVVLESRKSWILWDIYQIVIPLCDFFMAMALVVNRNFFTMRKTPSVNDEAAI